MQQMVPQASTIVSMHAPWRARRVTYGWIKSQIEDETKAGGSDLSKYATSTIVQTCAPTELGALRKADGKEGF